MTSVASPRCDGTTLCKLTLLALVEREPALEEWADRLSRAAARLALCASSNLSACLDPRR